MASEKKDEWASECSLVQGGRVASEKKMNGQVQV